MKKITLIIFSIIAINSFSQINFGLGIYQEFGYLYAKNSSYHPSSYKYKLSNLGLSVLFSKLKNEEGWYPEVKIDFTLLSDSSLLVNSEASNPVLVELKQAKTDDQISKTYDYNLGDAKSKHQTIQFTLNRQVHKNISIGGGVGFNLIQSKYNDLNGEAKYDWNAGTNSYLLSTSNDIRVNEASISEFTFIVPLNLRFHLPIKKKELILSNSFIFDINNRNYFQTLLLFKI